MKITIGDALKKGIEAHKSGKLEEADKLYTAILKIQPNHPDANHNLGVIAVVVGKLKEALPFFKKALEANQTVPQFWISYIDLLIKLKRISEAKVVFDQAQKSRINGDTITKIKNLLINIDNISPKNILSKMKLDQALRLAKQKLNDGLSEEAKSIYYSILIKFPKNKRAIEGMKNLSAEPTEKILTPKDPSKEKIQTLINYYNQGNFIKALDLAEKLLGQYPQSVFLHNIQGSINFNLKQYDNAIYNYKKALKIKPESADIYNNMGIIFKNKCDYKKAINSYKKALKIKPENAESYFNIGNVLRLKGQYENALKNYKKAIKIKPNYAEAYNNIGNILENKKDLDEAIKSYKQAVKINPNYTEVYYNIGSVLYKKDKLEDAIKSLREALKINPNFYLAQFTLGSVLKEKGKEEEAVESYKKTIEINPKFSEAHFNLGNIQKNRGELEAAIKSFEQALKFNPNYSKAYLNLGNVLKNQGNVKKAIENYKKALKINPNYAVAHYNLGNAYKDLENTEEAISSYKKALKIKPDYVFASHMLDSLTGNTRDSLPREYVTKLFDNYSKKFEESLIKKLKYKIPKILAQIIKKQKNISLFSVLDLGCGTGLMGLELSKYCKNIEGIDLSKPMLDQAHKKDVYDKLSHYDITEYLSQKNLDFDIFTSTDVFIYVGNLSEIFHLIKSRNKRNGKLIFSTEHTEKKGFYLEKSGRYSHSKEYILDLCQKYDYELLYFKKTNLRKEKNSFLTGGLYILGF